MELRNSGNPVNNIQIATLKEKTSLKLPKEYERFLQLNNGGYVDGFFVTPKFIEIDPESGKAYSQSSNVEKFYSVDEILEEYEANQEDPAWDENYLPIAYDSSGNVFLLLHMIQAVMYFYYAYLKMKIMGKSILQIMNYLIQ